MEWAKVVLAVLPAIGVVTGAIGALGFDGLSPGQVMAFKVAFEKLDPGVGTPPFLWQPIFAGAGKKWLPRDSRGLPSRHLISPVG